MGQKKRRKFSKEFKAKVALEALKEHKTISELASEYKLHATQIRKWKKAAKDSLPEVFGSTSTDDRRRHEELTSTLYEQIDRLKVELDWLKKKHDAID